MAIKDETDSGFDLATAIGYVRIAVYVLTALLGLSLLVVGTIAIIAQIKGTWHWSIHLESTISYVAVFVSYLLVVLVPLFVIMLAGRVVEDV
ncbi:MAG: hypothetical protein ACI8XM_002207 [Haloarculaceae archaeon]|jgi:hypothetical protein